MMYRCAPASSGSGKIVKKRGKSLRVDIHCHYLNTEAAAAVARHNPAQFDFLARFSNQLTRTVNERIAEIVAQWPERFVGLGTVPLQDAGLAVSELDHCVKQLGLRGVEINPSVNGLDLTDAKLGLDKFFSKVQDLDVLIFMHPVGFTHGERLMDHYLNNVIGNPLETTVAASHLIFDGMMERFPKLKILLPHGGGYRAHYWARMDHAHRARPDCRVRIKRKPSSYLEKFYFDSLTFDPGMLHHLVERFGADHVLLGTDYPYDMGVEDPVGFIGGVRKLSSLERRQIMGGNAARLLKIDYNNRTRRRSWDSRHLYWDWHAAR